MPVISKLRWNRWIEWNYRPHSRSTSIRLYFKLAVQFVESFAHSGKTDSCFRTYSTEQVQPV